MVAVIKSHIKGDGPKQIMLDFEVGAIKAFSQTFDKAEMRGCYFHFCQALFRNIQEKG